MERRKYLASVGFTLGAGCIGERSENKNSSTTMEQDTNQGPIQCNNSALKDEKMRVEGDVLRKIKIESDVSPLDYDVDLIATTLRDAITTEHTARIRVLFIYTGNGSQAYTFGDNPPFSNRWDDRSEHVWALDVAKAEHEPVLEDCWAVEVESIGKEDVAKSEELQHCDVLSTDLDLWQLWRGEDDQCMPTGTFRFEEKYDVGKLAGADDSFRWGFDLSISEP